MVMLSETAIIQQLNRVLDNTIRENVSKYIIIEHTSVAMSHEYIEHPWPVFNLFVQYRHRGSNKSGSVIFKQNLCNMDLIAKDNSQFLYNYISGFYNFHKFLGRVLDINI